MLVNQPFIRLVKKKDIPQLVALCKEHADYEQAGYNPKGKIEMLSQNLFSSKQDNIVFVLDDGGKLLGYSTILKQFSTWEADFYYYMDCLYLQEQARGKGYGKMMMNEIKKYALNENCNVQWQTPQFNKKAIKFYKSIGAESKTKQRFFWDVVEGIKPGLS